ncbi:TetR/AcrR family transcriptional regulator [Leucobacter albus]|uniref:TetR/AcrR family transcriptional regulator n=1 Tax=Leucobacter albus TaxID=272210 RepID=A0ABW3TQA9_9MICO
MAEAAPIGRRERKKAATRKAISDTATLMFLERGFDNVSIREIAEKADVSPTTVFAHFPQKEALVFDEDEEHRDGLVSAVRDRPAGVSITDALYEYYLHGMLEDRAEHGDSTREFLALLDRTPALADYAARMWTRHEHALGAAIAADMGLAEPSPEIRAYARFVLQIQLLANNDDDPAAMLAGSFRILNDGWRSFADPTAGRDDSSY